MRKESLFLCFCMGALLCAASVRAAAYSAVSPDGKNEIRLMDGDVLRYAVYRNGKPLVMPTEIGMAIEGHGAPGKKPVVCGRKSAALDETIRTPVYKKREVRAVGNELTVSFEGGFDVVLRAYDDGVAYRFATRLPGRIKVMEERGGLAFAEDYSGVFAYGDPYLGEQELMQCSWESPHNRARLSELRMDRMIYCPILVLYPDGTSLAFTDSALLDYPGFNLRRDPADAKRLNALLAQYPTAFKDNGWQRQVKERAAWIAETDGTRAFPWRLFMLADNAVKLIESDMVYKLGEPCQIADTSWVKPGLVAWDWWSNQTLTGVGFRAGCNTETYLHYVDFAARNRLPYVLLDGGWAKNGNVDTIEPGVDLQLVIDTARAKGVGIILWASWPQLQGRQEQVFSRYAAMGVRGFKTDFVNRDDQLAVRFTEETARIGAKYHLLIAFHGCFKPTGLGRTWPNVVNYEGVYGLENYKWEEGKVDFMANDCLIPFTRMLAGPLDYTPGSFKNVTRQAYKPAYDLPVSQGTRVHQMAMFALFEAPIQMLAEAPTVYAQEQACTDFIQKIPTVWDETRGVAGEPGEYVVVARRKGNVWHVAVLGNWTARTLTLDFGFLGKGRFRAEIFADGLNADRTPTDYQREMRTLRADETLKLSLAPGGGWTARIEPAVFWRF